MTKIVIGRPYNIRASKEVEHFCVPTLVPVRSAQQCATYLAPPRRVTVVRQESFYDEFVYQRLRIYSESEYCNRVDPTFSGRVKKARESKDSAILRKMYASIVLEKYCEKRHRMIRNVWISDNSVLLGHSRFIFPMPRGHNDYPLGKPPTGASQVVSGVPKSRNLRCYFRIRKDIFVAICPIRSYEKVFAWCFTPMKYNPEICYF